MLILLKIYPFSLSTDGNLLKPVLPGLLLATPMVSYVKGGGWSNCNDKHTWKRLNRQVQNTNHLTLLNICRHLERKSAYTGVFLVNTCTDASKNTVVTGCS